MKFRRIGKPFFLTTTVLLGCLHLGNLVGTDENFRVKNVVVSGNRYLTVENILDAAQIPTGENTFKVEVRPIVERLESLPFIKAVEVIKTYPATLEIIVTERVPVAFFNHEGLLPVDETGNILPPIALPVQPDLPLISGVAIEKTANLQRLAIRGIRLCEFVDHLYHNRSELFHQISEFRLRGDQLTIYLLRSGVPVNMGDTAWLEKCQRLQAVIQHVPLDFSNLERIDLRFANQIITCERVTRATLGERT